MGEIYTGIGGKVVPLGVLRSTANRDMTMLFHSSADSITLWPMKE